MSKASNQHILDAMKAEGIVNNRTNAVAAFNKIGASSHVGFTLAAVCAMLYLETSGMNYWGHDPNGYAHPPDAGEVVVTEAAYKEYLTRIRPGVQAGRQGVGPCQLTWWSYQEEADKLGGCWRPYENMLVGFQVLKGDMLAGGSAFQGFWSWNGRTSAGQAYANNAVAVMNRFQAAFNRP